MATLRRATSTPDIMASQNSTVHQSSHEDTSVKFRRTRRCAGCHEPHEHHSWGQPGPHCQGRDEESEGEVEDDADHGGEDQTSFTTLRDADFGLASAMNPSMPQTGAPTGPDDSERLALEAKLRQLALEERRLADLDSLRRKVADKEASVLKMRQRQKQVAQQQQHKQQGQTITSGLSAAQQLPKNAAKAPVLSSLLGSGPPLSLQGHALPAGPVGTSLPAVQPGLPWQLIQNQTTTVPPVNGVTTAANQPVSLHDQFLARSDHHADMFLAPAAVPLGEKVLRIVDYTSSLVPRETEQTLSDMGGSRLLISYGQQRPRLESVSLSQWVVANTRIFHSLLFSCKLPTSRDVRDYLAYTVKIMELAGKYEWTSVLKFDDEFRQLQATYSFPWSHDSTHLHQITLVPKVKPKQNNSIQPSSFNQSFVGPNTAVYSADNKVICRKFNSTGCQNSPCHFAHVCNRKVKGKACSSSHPATQHGSPGPTSG